MVLDDELNVKNNLVANFGWKEAGPPSTEISDKAFENILVHIKYNPI